MSLFSCPRTTHTQKGGIPLTHLFRNMLDTNDYVLKSTSLTFL